MKPEKALDAVADKVLTYRPKPKSAPAKRRKRRKLRIIAARLREREVANTLGRYRQDITIALCSYNREYRGNTGVFSDDGGKNRV